MINFQISRLIVTIHTDLQIKPCDTPPCDGPITETRACNTKPCRSLVFETEILDGQWSCWSDWTECSVSCGFGVRSRSRECLQGSGRCDGPSQQRESCEMPNCEFYRGWHSWSSWSRCDEANMQHRKRKCLVVPSDVECLGPSKQSRWCINDLLDNGEFVEREREIFPFLTSRVLFRKFRRM